MAIIHGDVNNFDELIKDDLTLVDFYATWCGPCRMLSPVLEEISEERNSVKIVKVDIDENMELAKRFGIMSVPTLILFKDGTPVTTHNGYLAKELLIDLIQKY